MGKKSEPDITAALKCWDELSNKWTPIGWKEHIFRFDVLFNGTIHGQPWIKRRGQRWQGLGIQLSFADRGHRYDSGAFVQKWDDCPAPVLLTEWQHQGFLMRQRVFAHCPSGAPDVEGARPLYAWVRVEVAQTCEPLPADDWCTLSVDVNAPHIIMGMHARNNIEYADSISAYPRTLSQEASGGILRVLEPDGRVRMAAAGGNGAEAALDQEKSQLAIRIPGKEGAFADLLVPIMPTPREAFDQELSLGCVGALARANKHWSVTPQTAAVFDCPEEYINRAIHRNLQISRVIAEHDPEIGRTALLTGSLAYQAVWATPVAMTIALFLDYFGHHEEARGYLELFRQTQGKVDPPSPHIPPHPGYLCAPKDLTPIAWITDHGAILWAMSEHLLISGREPGGWLQAIVKGCEFIRDARRITGHGGIEGLMPPAVNTDRRVATQSVWSDGWNYKGLVTAVRLLVQAGHPRADEFRHEANTYRAVFVNAFRARAAEMPVWTAPDGTEYPLVPTALSGDSPEGFRTFYLDTGPLFLVFAGLMSARDPLMAAAMRWFREGPQVEWYRRDAGPWQMPCLDMEMSSCEPGYSWNVYHSHQTRDRRKFLEAMYSHFAGAMSQQTYTVCETRGGITGLCPCLPCFPMARLAVIDDLIEPGALHLMRLAPPAWLREDRTARFERIPTEFGPVSLEFGLARGGRRLEVSFTTGYRARPKAVIMHVPPVSGLSEIALNGTRLEWNGRNRKIRID